MGVEVSTVQENQGGETKERQDGRRRRVTVTLSSPKQTGGGESETEVEVY